MILSFPGELQHRRSAAWPSPSEFLWTTPRSRLKTSSDNFEEGHAQRDAILEGAAQIALPALVSTLCICIVFLPMFLLSGVARYLFVPLAEAVVFAMLASYILSRTLVPTLAMYLLKAKRHDRASSRNPLVRFQLAFERGFERLRNAYHSLLIAFVHRRGLFIRVSSDLSFGVSPCALARPGLLSEYG